jgi:Mg2+ and Co2+ transporter CorA
MLKTYQLQNGRLRGTELLVMIVSAVVPYIWFKRRGWL